jgi:diguanylate cyclase (GGDEF)-like protein
MEKIPQSQELFLTEELERARMELAILYEISNAMRTTLHLDEILYIILTGVTAHSGLGFNRAMLFLVNERDNLIEGRMGIGPDTGEQAGQIWSNIETANMDLEDLINVYKSSKKMLDSQFNRVVTQLKIPIHEKEGGIIALAVHDGMPLHLDKEALSKYQNDPILKFLHSDELAIVPLRAKDKINGIVVADNLFTHKPISRDDMRMFIMLANQAGLAIENSRLYEQMVIKSHTDSLTNLWNHGYFQFLLQEEIDKSKAIHMPVSLVMLDIDYFKNYNDTLGHQMGDRVLEEIAKVLKDYSRKIDKVCRYGGEEFAIILPQTNKKEAYFIAERLRESVEKHTFVQEEVQPRKRITVSIGIATFPEDAEAKSELIAFADKLMYKAKAEGRNKTCTLID